jgi:hypothetical protein
VRNNLSADYKLGNDIDLTQYLSPNGEGYNNGHGWEPIGNGDFPFTGNFDGNGYKITGLWLNRDSDYAGLFGHISNGGIKNLSVEISDKRVTGRLYVGGLVGFSDRGYIKNCHVSGVVSGRITGGVAGILGYGNNLLNCSSKGSVLGREGFSARTGGFAGFSYMSNRMEQCYSTCDVSSPFSVGFERSYTGGFLGHAHGFTTIANCYAVGTVSGSDYTGGFIGFSISNSNNIMNCYSAGGVSGTEPFVGGFAGRTAFDSIAECFFDREASGQERGVGGGSNEGVFSRTTAQMKMRDTFTHHGWDFTTIWKIIENKTYPFLRLNPPLG